MRLFIGLLAALTTGGPDPLIQLAAFLTHSQPAQATQSLSAMRSALICFGLLLDRI